jgi:hypothetical protein
MLKGQPTKKIRKRARPPDSWNWTEEHQEAFDFLIEQLTCPPILAYADYSKPFEVHIDASTDGLGAVLYQDQDGQARVIAYASRGLRKSERNYPAHKLEFLALKWAVTDKFHEYLYGNQFEVKTDNNPLTYVLTSAKLDATGHRWLAALSTYNFKITYRAGINNQDADALSRHPTFEKSMSVNAPEIQAICQVLHTTCAPVECLSCDVKVVCQEEIDNYAQDISTVDWKAEQAQDPNILRVLDIVKRGSKPTARQRSMELPFIKKVLGHWDKLHIRNGVLYYQQS